jgi:hypothetical protein
VNAEEKRALEIIAADSGQAAPDRQAAAELLAAANATSDALVDLIGGTVAVVTAALPDLTVDDLSRLNALELEKGDFARKGVLSAIAAELLKRGEGGQ